MSEKSHKTSRAMRDSNIELFRIITMIMIVAHHYVVNSGLLDIVEAQRSLGTPYLILHAIGSVLGVYIVCTIIDILRARFLEKPIFNKIEGRWKKWKELFLPEVQEQDCIR